VAVINETVAKHFFPKGNAVGSSLSIDSSTVSGPWRIVGVARDTKAGGPRGDAVRMVYVPLAQIAATVKGDNGPEDNGDRFASTIELRTVGDPANTVRALRSAMAEVNPNIPLLQVHTIGETLDGLMAGEALISRLTAIFSLLAVGLAGIGLYGVMSYNVVRRTPEIGIRLALGARTETVQWMVLRESLLLLGIGICLGLPLTFAATTVIRKQLFGLTATDPMTFLVAISVVTGMTFFAAWWPARRATRIDPMVALRAE
jgi:ABC-type antimicrobial peptide transport system permease subunit